MNFPTCILGWLNIPISTVSDPTTTQSTWPPQRLYCRGNHSLDNLLAGGRLGVILMLERSRLRTRRHGRSGDCRLSSLHRSMVAACLITVIRRAGKQRMKDGFNCSLWPRDRSSFWIVETGWIQCKFILGWRAFFNEQGILWYQATSQGQQSIGVRDERCIPAACFGARLCCAFNQRTQVEDQR